jgi:hypothetical protein
MLDRGGDESGWEAAEGRGEFRKPRNQSVACKDDGQAAAIAAANSLFVVPRVVRGAQKVNRVTAIQGTLERNTPGRVFARAQH